MRTAAAMLAIALSMPGGAAQAGGRFPLHPPDLRPLAALVVYSPEEAGPPLEIDLPEIPVPRPPRPAFDLEPLRASVPAATGRPCGLVARWIGGWAAAVRCGREEFRVADAKTEASAKEWAEVMRRLEWARPADGVLAVATEASYWLGLAAARARQTEGVAEAAFLHAARHPAARIAAFADYELGTIALGRRDLLAAVTHFDRALAHDSEIHAARHGRALALYELDRYAEAREQWERVSTASDASPKIVRAARLWIGETLGREGRPGEAIEVLKPLAKAGEPHVLLALGWFYRAAGRPKEAVAALEELLRAPEARIRDRALAGTALALADRRCFDRALGHATEISDATERLRVPTLLYLRRAAAQGRGPIQAGQPGCGDDPPSHALDDHLSKAKLTADEKQRWCVIRAAESPVVRKAHRDALKRLSRHETAAPEVRQTAALLLAAVDFEARCYACAARRYEAVLREHPSEPRARAIGAARAWALIRHGQQLAREGHVADAAAALGTARGAAALDPTSPAGLSLLALELSLDPYAGSRLASDLAGATRDEHGERSVRLRVLRTLALLADGRARDAAPGIDAGPNSGAVGVVAQLANGARAAREARWDWAIVWFQAAVDCLEGDLGSTSAEDRADLLLAARQGLAAAVFNAGKFEEFEKATDALLGIDLTRPCPAGVRFSSAATRSTSALGQVLLARLFLVGGPGTEHGGRIAARIDDCFSGHLGGVRAESLRCPRSCDSGADPGALPPCGSALMGSVQSAAREGDPLARVEQAAGLAKAKHVELAGIVATAPLDDARAADAVTVLAAKLDSHPCRATGCDAMLVRLVSGHAHDQRVAAAALDVARGDAPLTSSSDEDRSCRRALLRRAASDGDVGTRAEAAHRLGDQYRREGKDRAALEMYAYAAEVGPDTPWAARARVALACTYIDDGRPAYARALAERVLKRSTLDASLEAKARDIRRGAERAAGRPTTRVVSACAK